MAFQTKTFVAGHTYCFTARLADPEATVLTDNLALFRDCVRLARLRMPFDILTACVLPSEVHMIWQLPEDQWDYGHRWRLIKSTFARHLPATRSNTGLRRAGDGSLWQRRLWEAPIRDTVEMTLYELHCLTAPVRAGLVASPEDWPYSSLTWRSPPPSENGTRPDQGVSA